MKKDEVLLTATDEVLEYNPCAVLTATNVVPHFFPGIKVQLFHGFNAKKRDMHRGHFRLRGFFDLYCTQGPATTLPFKELASQKGYFDVVETGWPKTDPLFTGNEKFHPGRKLDITDVQNAPFTANEKYRPGRKLDTTDVQNAPFTANEKYRPGRKPTILFTSTFTPALSAAHRLVDTFENIVRARPEWNWSVTLHPKMDQEITRRYRNFALTNENLIFSDTDDVIPLLKSSDVMVSDTSSIISEFLLLDKPVVTLNNREPGPHLVNIASTNEIAKAVEYALSRPLKLMKAIENYVKDIHPYRDGRCAGRVMDAVEARVQKGTSHLKPKPLNILRKLKIRRRLNYWKW